MNRIIIKGHIEVFPKDRGRLSKKKKPFEEQTIVVNVSNDLGKLYRSLILKNEGVLLEPPPFGCHVTLNNGRASFNVEKHKQYLEKLNGKTIQLSIDVNVYRYWEFYALPVDGFELNKIRQKLGLAYKDDFHITIGRIHPLAKLPSILTKTLD